MRELVDNNTDLVIKNFTDSELRENSLIKSTVNSWSSDEKIREYITSNCIWGDNLFDYLYGLNNYLNTDDSQFSQLYFIFDNSDELLAVSQLSNTKSKFRKAIQFIAVNPNMQNQGIGSRLINSIINNPDFFNKERQQFLLAAASEQSNTATRRLLKKHNFIPYKKPKNSTLILYLRLWKSKEMGE